MLLSVTELFRALRGPSRSEREHAYLSAARDLTDLDYRQRQIDRGLFREPVARYY